MIIFIQIPVQDILLMVVTQALVSNVGLYVLALTLPSLLLLGIVALPYHLNQFVIPAPDVL